MRTTVELPPELMRAAKSRSAESGESLKSLLTRALEAELQVASRRPGRSARVTFPLFGSATGKRVNVSNRDLEQVLAEDDRARVTPSAARPRKSR